MPIEIGIIDVTLTDSTDSNVDYEYNNYIYKCSQCWEGEGENDK